MDFHAVSDQLVPEFYTLDSVTRVIQEMARRVVAVFGTKTGIRISLLGLSSFLLLYTHVLFSNMRRLFGHLFRAIKYEVIYLEFELGLRDFTCNVLW